MSDIAIKILSIRSDCVLFFPESILCIDLCESVSMTTWSGLLFYIHSSALGRATS